jgi:hypothetical protein
MTDRPTVVMCTAAVVLDPNFSAPITRAIAPRILMSPESQLRIVPAESGKTSTRWDCRRGPSSRARVARR